MEFSVCSLEVFKECIDEGESALPVIEIVIMAELLVPKAKNFIHIFLLCTFIEYFEFPKFAF